MLRRVIGVIPGCVIFIYLVASIESIATSKIIGIMAFSVAFGSYSFIAIAAPYGFQRSAVVFGKERDYLVPVPAIPRRIGLAIIGSTMFLAILAFGLYHFGY